MKIVTKQNIQIGLKVIPGRDWSWGNQNGRSEYGTVVDVKGHDWCSVEWKNGYKNAYHVGKDENGICDLYMYRESFIKDGSEKLVKKILKLNNLEQVTVEMLEANGLQEHIKK